MLYKMETPISAPGLDAVKAARLAEINAGCQTALAGLTQTYPDRELNTFDKQEAEARAWLADNSAPTPFLSALAAARGIELAELARRVVAKADAFAVASGHLVGQRQRMEDMLDACATVEDVLAIEIVYSLPDAESMEEA